MKIIIFYRIGKKVCIEQINKLPCIKKRFKCITVWNSKTLNANYLSKKKINSSLIRCTLLTRWEQTMKLPGKQWYKITLRNLLWSHLAKNTGIISFCDSFYSSEGIIYWSTQYASIKCPINIISLFLLYCAGLC